MPTDTVEAKCQEIFETNLDDLEAEFWEDVQKGGIPFLPTAKRFSSTTGFATRAAESRRLLQPPSILWLLLDNPARTW